MLDKLMKDLNSFLNSSGTSATYLENHPVKPHWKFLLFLNFSFCFFVNFIYINVIIVFTKKEAQKRTSFFVL